MKNKRVKLRANTVMSKWDRGELSTKEAKRRLSKKVQAQSGPKEYKTTPPGKYKMPKEDIPEVSIGNVLEKITNLQSEITGIETLVTQATEDMRKQAGLEEKTAEVTSLWEEIRGIVEAQPEKIATFKDRVYAVMSQEVRSKPQYKGIAEELVKEFNDITNNRIEKRFGELQSRKAKIKKVCEFFTAPKKLFGQITVEPAMVVDAPVGMINELVAAVQGVREIAVGVNSDLALLDSVLTDAESKLGVGRAIDLPAVPVMAQHTKETAEKVIRGCKLPDAIAKSYLERLDKDDPESVIYEMYEAMPKVTTGAKKTAQERFTDMAVGQEDLIDIRTMADILNDMGLEVAEGVTFDVRGTAFVVTKIADGFVTVKRQSGDLTATPQGQYANKLKERIDRNASAGPTSGRFQRRIAMNVAQVKEAIMALWNHDVVDYKTAEQLVKRADLAPTAISDEVLRLGKDLKDASIERIAQQRTVNNLTEDYLKKVTDIEGEQKVDNIKDPKEHGDTSKVKTDKGGAGYKNETPKVPAAIGHGTTKVSQLVPKPEELKFKVGDDVKIVRTTDSKCNEAENVGKTGRIVTLGGEPPYHYELKDLDTQEFIGLYCEEELERVETDKKAQQVDDSYKQDRDFKRPTDDEGAGQGTKQFRVNFLGLASYVVSAVDKEDAEEKARIIWREKVEVPAISSIHEVTDKKGQLDIRETHTEEEINDDSPGPQTIVMAEIDNVDDLIDVMTARKGGAVAGQLRSITDGYPLEDQNPNALAHIAEFLLDRREEDAQEVGEEVKKYLVDKFGYTGKDWEATL